MDGEMAFEGRKGSTDQIYFVSSSDLCYVHIFASFGNMRKPSKCHCTILVEFKPTEERNPLGKMGKGMFTTRGGWDWLPYDP